MKRLFTFLILLMALTGSVWGVSYTWFPESTHSMTGSGNGPHEFTQKIWWHDDGAGQHGALPDDWAYRDFDFYSTVISGDLNVTFLGSHNENGTYLGGLKVQFTGTKGTIEITAVNEGKHDGNRYECKYILYYNSYNKKWDFNSKYLELQETNEHWNGPTNLINRDGSSETRQYYPYKYTVDSGTDATYFFKNIPEGLKFQADNEKFGCNDPHDGDGTERYNRYVAFGQGSSITIPASELQKCENPRIRIKMTRAGDARHLTIQNGKDALGQNITSDYVIGGSQWRDYNTYKDNNYRGEYHFSVQDKNQDFKITTTSGDWLLLLYVELYDSKDLITENSILGDTYQLLNNGQYDNANYGQEGAKGTYYLHYYGMGERASLDYSTITTTGTVTYDENRFKSIDAFNTVYQSKVGEFGTFRMRLNCYSYNNSDNEHYCTDYAYRTQSVGYLQYKHYPYTWDFTDVKTYSSDGMATEDGYKNNTNLFKDQSDFTRNQWESISDGIGHRLAVDAGHNVLFCGGSQLWYGNTIIPETAGLGFTPVNYDAAYNDAMTFTSEGLSIAQDIRSWWLWRITVPQVSSQDVIYVRAHRLPQQNVPNPLYNKPNYPGQPERIDIPFYNAGYYYGDANNETSSSAFATEGNVPKMYNVVGDDSGDVIYVIPGNSTTSNVTLFFSGVTIKKIAVSEDPKRVNKYGWATESRNRVIDPELTAYMTGYPFEAYVVTGANTAEKTVTLERVNLQNKVMKKAYIDEPQNRNGDDEKEAYIIHNTNNKEVKIINDGFHLFVPDMHDYLKGNEGNGNKKSTKDMSGSLLLTKLNPGTVQQTANGKTNYVLTYQVTDDADNNNQNVGVDEYDKGYVGFFKVRNNGVTSPGNQGYLPVNTNASVDKFRLVFVDEEETSGITTPQTATILSAQQNVYYNLNGQRLNGTPSQAGIYIVNGKKVFIK